MWIIYTSIKPFGEKRTGSVPMLITAIFSVGARHPEGTVWGLLVNNIALCSPHRDSAPSPGPGWAGSLLPAAARFIWMDRIKLLGKAGPQSPQPLGWNSQSGILGYMWPGNKKLAETLGDLGSPLAVKKTNPGTLSKILWPSHVFL